MEVGLIACCIYCSCRIHSWGDVLNIPASSLKINSSFNCSGEEPPRTSVLNSASENLRWRISFCRDFLNQGPRSWSDRRSGMGNRTARWRDGADTSTEVRVFTGERESSKSTSGKSLCWEDNKANSPWKQACKTTKPCNIKQKLQL